MKNVKLNIQRWLRMSSLAIISCSICIILYPAFNLLTSKIINLVPISHPTIGTIMVWFIFSTLCCFVLIRLGGFRFNDFWSINSLYYPPTWLFALISAALYFLIAPILWKLPPVNQFSIEILFIIILALVSALMIASLLNLILSSWRKYFTYSEKIATFKTGSKDLKSVLQDPVEFINWLEEEKPIHDPNQDLFHLTVFAKHLVRIFRSTPLKTIAIIGDYGCGKSSILKMTEYFLQNPQNLSKEEQKEKVFDSKKIIQCKVSGWGLQKGEAAHYILKSVIKDLSDHVDCLGLADIPAHYRSAISNSGFGWSKAFAAITCNSKDALELLQQVDTVLKCIRQRMVIFLEDLDRNTFDKTYWDEITSLLDRLKDLDNITFVLAINQQDNAQENVLLRIAEHAVYVPPLDKVSVIEGIVKFRDICFNMTSGKDIDYISQEERDQHFGIKKTSQEYEIAEMLGIEVRTPIEAIAKLLNNPRLLKAALRHTWHTWQSLHGEIDFDSLLVSRVIYTASPIIYAYINENISQIRQLAYEESNNKYSRERIEKISTKLHSDLEHIISNNLDVNTIAILMQFLFPGWIKDDFYKIKKVQGVFVKEPTDYWIRLNREEILENETRDQKIICAIKNWKNDQMKGAYNGLTLSEALLKVEGFAEKVEQFGLILDGQEVRVLASQLFMNIIEEIKRQKKFNEDYKGFYNLWRLSLDKQIDEHEKWVIEELRKALPNSISFSNAIYYYWRNQNRGYHREQTPFIRNEYIKAWKETFENNSQALINAIDPIQIYSIRHFVIYYNEPEVGGPGFKAEEWQWIAPILIEAGIKNLQLIVPQIVALVVDSENIIREHKTIYEYTFNTKRVADIFTSNTHNVMELLSKEIDISQFDTYYKDIIQFAKIEAQKWISEKHSLGSGLEI